MLHYLKSLQNYVKYIIIFMCGKFHIILNLEVLDMKNRTIILLIVVALAMCLLTGCSTKSNKPDTLATDMSNFRTIEGKEYLVYSIDTRVVYYMFITTDSTGYAGYAYFAPYISESGNFCRYINGEIVEIVRIEDSNY